MSADGEVYSVATLSADGETARHIGVATLTADGQAYTGCYFMARYVKVASLTADGQASKGCYYDC